MPNKLSKFWQELKRRNVIRVITVYTGAAFVILSLVDMIREPFELPNWSIKLIVVLLSIGLIIAVILSWIYDIHPEEGVVKTEPADQVNPEEIPKSSNSWKIASYISFVVIVGLIALNIIGVKRGPRIDESLAKSIAVLPFRNLTGDPDQEYMCEGLTNEIISHLFKVRTFDEVKGYTSVFPFKDSDKGQSEIAQALKVNYLLEGTYIRMGESLKVTATLIEAKSGKIIWTHDYDAPYHQVMGIPGNIALNVVDYLRASITEGEQQSIKRRPTDNLEAYEIGNQIVYQFIRYYGSNSSMDQIIELCQRAIDLDPYYAEAYAYLGLAVLHEVNFVGDREVFSVYLDAEHYLNKALELDPYNMLANAGRAFLNYWIRWDYTGMEDFKKAFPNASQNDLVASMLMLYELQMGHYNKVLFMHSKDTATDYLLKANILLGNHREAENQINQMVAYNNPVSKMYVIEGYIWLQEFDTALSYMESEELKNSTIIFPRYGADKAVIFFKTGNEDLARSIIGQLIEASDTTTIRSPAYFTGWYYSWIGERDSAFYWLDKAVNNHSVEIPWLKVDPAFSSLKDDPRYLDLLEDTRFKEYDEYMASTKE